MTGRRLRRDGLRGVVRAVAWHRRLLAGGLAAAAVAMGMHALGAPPPPTVDVVAASSDLAGGVTIAPEHLRTVALPAESVPDGVVRPDEPVTGRVLAGPVRAGEPLTDVRLVGPALVAGWGRHLVAAPVRVADGASVSLVRPGDRVDLIATATTGETGARVVAGGVPVLATPAGDDAGGLLEGSLVVVAVTRTQAGELATAAVTSRVSLALVAAAGDG